MVTKELLDYINYQLDHGESWESTKRDLAASGWGVSTLDEAFAQITTEKSKTISTNVPSPMIEVASNTEAIENEIEKQRTTGIPTHDLTPNTTKSPVSLDLKKEPQGLQAGISVPGLPQKEASQPKKNNLGLMITLVIILLLVLAGGTFAYFNYFNSESVMAKVFQNSQNIESGEFTGTLEFDYSPSEKVKQEISNLNLNKIYGKLELGGKYSFKDPSNIKMDLALKIDSKNENNENYILNSDIKIIDNDAYIKVNDIIIPEEYEQYIGPFRSNFISKWLQAGFTNQGPEENISFYLNRARNEVKINSSELSKKIIKAAVLNFKGFEGCNSSVCIKYGVVFNSDKVKDLISKIATENGATAEDLANSDEEISKLVSQIAEKLELEITVGSSDFMIHKMSFVIKDKNEEGEISINGLISSSKENSNIEVDPVTESTDMETFINQIISTSSVAAIDEEIKNSLGQIKSAAENYKTIKGTYVGFNQSDEVNSIFSTLNGFGGNTAVVYATKDKYCITKDLVINTGKYYCIDSANYLGEGMCNKDTTLCINPSTTSSENPQNPEEIKSEQPVVPVVNPNQKSEVEVLIDSLATALQKHNSEKSTYLGYISSKDGIKAVNKINEFEGNPLVVATSKAKFCIMKENGENIYCVDSTNYSGSSNKCSSKNISCQ
ncbi:hypothetical protein M0R01_02270 [bacterium]|nr:hypothetical protein [bacterium]